MTRAYFALLRLDFREAFYYHPLFWTVPIIAVGWLLLTKFSEKENILHQRVRMGVSVILILIMAAYFVVYVIRFLDPSCTVVSVDMEGGGILPMFLRVWRFIFK